MVRQWSHNGWRGRRHTLVLQFAQPELCWANCMVTKTQGPCVLQGNSGPGQQLEDKTEEGETDYGRGGKGWKEEKQVEGRKIPRSSCTTSQLQLGNDPHLGRVVSRVLQSVW